ncbi:MAG TPA: type II secretion system F family protein [Candidatus Dojkabacteria bacterium]|nr:type II secretion system F family protein [Candidatus Dojkabacteria bacterium]
MKFKYTARDQNGKNVIGVLEGRSRETIVEALKTQKLVVVSVEEDLGFSLETLKEINIGGVPQNDKVIFMRQLATMVAAGLPLTQALEILETQATNPLFKKTLSEVLGDVQSGEGLSASFRKHKGVFDDITLNLLQAGEESGNLEIILNRLSVELENQKKLSEKITSAFIYPAVILFVIIIVILLMMFVLVPAMSKIYGEFNAKLPWVTQVMIDASNFFINYWWLVLIVVAVVAIVSKYYYDTPSGRKFVNRVMVKIPIFGSIIIKIQIAQFTRILSLLLKSGLSIVKALELTAGSLSNVVYQEAVMEAKTEVEKGTSLAIPIARSQIFPLIVSQMIAVGEESGEMDSVLEKMSEYYNDEVNVATSNLTTLMEPIMLLLMGSVIAFIALAVYMPMFNLSSVIG